MARHTAGGEGGGGLVPGRFGGEGEEDSQMERIRKMERMLRENVMKVCQAAYCAGTTQAGCTVLYKPDSGTAGGAGRPRGAQGGPRGSQRPATARPPVGRALGPQPDPLPREGAACRDGEGPGMKGVGTGVC